MADYSELIARINYYVKKAEFMGLEEAESTLLLKKSAAAIEDLQNEINSIYKREMERLNGDLNEAQFKMSLQATWNELYYSQNAGYSRIGKE